MNQSHQVIDSHLMSPFWPIMSAAHAIVKTKPHSEVCKSKEYKI